MITHPYLISKDTINKISENYEKLKKEWGVIFETN